MTRTFRATVDFEIADDQPFGDRTDGEIFEGLVGEPIAVKGGKFENGLWGHVIRVGKVEPGESVMELHGV